MAIIGQSITPEKRITTTIVSNKKEEAEMVMPADWVPGPRQGEWTHEMYTALPDDGQRYEIVQGVLMSLSSEPTSQGNEKEAEMVVPADWVPGPRQGQWTYEMYAALPDDGHRYEVVKGVLMMSDRKSVV